RWFERHLSLHPLIAATTRKLHTTDILAIVYGDAGQNLTNGSGTDASERADGYAGWHCAQPVLMGPQCGGRSTDWNDAGSSRQQGSLECAGDRLLALAGANSIADDSDALPRLGQPLQALGGSAAGPVVEPVANSRRREQPGDAGPARGALV